MGKSQASSSKAMKKESKVKPLKKEPLTKGAKIAAMKKETLKKEPLTKTALKKAALNKLGSVPLNEKVARACDEVETPEEAALVLRDSLSKLDKSNVWSQHQTHLRHNPEEKQEYMML